MLKLLLALLLVLPAQEPIAPEPSRFWEGQVWEYRTRPGDEGSLLKIQRMESSPDGPIYHISVIGVRIGSTSDNQIQHLPVSEETLSVSVTRITTRIAEFPSPDVGIALWREAQGGVFTIPLDQIIEIAAQQIGEMPQTAPPPVT